jgi:chromosome segregation ATPase
MTTLEDLERRIATLEGTVDLSHAVEKLGDHLEDVRLRMTRVEAALYRLETATTHLTAGQANVRARIDAVEEHFDKLEADIADLRRDLPSIIADAVRETRVGAEGNL